MSDGTDRPGRPGADETGEPLGLLSDLRVEASPRFLGRLRGRIRRRVLGVQVLDLTWFGPAVVFFEFFRREDDGPGRKE